MHQLPETLWASIAVRIMPQIKKPQHSKKVKNASYDVRGTQKVQTSVWSQNPRDILTSFYKF